MPRWLDTTAFSSLSLSDVLAGAAISVGASLVLFWLIGLIAAFVSALALSHGFHRFAALSSHFSPLFMRRLIAAILGMNLMIVPAANASSAITSAVDPAWQSSSISQSTQSGQASTLPSPQPIDPGWQASAPSVAPGPLVAPETRPVLPGASPYEIVRPGDSLWTIAARTLGPLASEAEIAHEWPRWYAMNRESIGNSPNLLIPGTLLQVPPHAE